MFFHIDEDAYQKLTRYFEAIKRSLSNSTGQDEIIKDIEMRIAELVSEKHTSDKQVINVKELDEIIAIMGQPEDYRIEEEPADPDSPLYTRRSRKRLYRDTERGMLGGVTTGLGHYFGIDAVWIRIIFLILLIGFGTGIIAYIILWIAIPAAVTTTEKLEMTGEPVTISNIEKKVREEFENVAQRFKGSDYPHHARTGAERFASSVGSVFMAIFRVIAKIIGVLLIIWSATVLIGMLIGLFTLGSTSFVDVPWQNYIDAVNYTNIPLWIIALLIFFAVGIPFFFLFILGLKLLISNVKSIGSVAKYTLLAVWLISVGVLIALGVKQATEVGFDGKDVRKERLQLTSADTLKIKFRYNDFYAKGFEYRNNYMFTQDEKGNEIIYSNEVSITILKTDEKQPYLQVEKIAEGRSMSEAKERAERIQYGYKIEGNTIILDNYLITSTQNKYRNQEVEIFLYLPKGTLFQPDSSLQEYDYSDDYFFNLHFSGDYLYRVDENKVLCLDCPPDEDEFEDIPEIPAMDSIKNGISIKVNGKNVLLPPPHPGHPDHGGRFKQDEKGVIIKIE